MVSVTGGGTVNEIEVKVAGQIQDLKRALGSASRKLNGLVKDATETSRALSSIDTGGVSAKLQALRQSANGAGEKLDDLADESNDASRSFTRLSLTAGPATVGITGIGSAAALAVGPVLTLGAAVSALTTAALGIAGATAALGGMFGLIIGSGALAAHQAGWLGSELNQMKEEVVDLVAEFGQQFMPLIRDAINAFPTLVQRILDSIGPTDQFREALRKLGQIALKEIPKITGAMADIARKVLPEVMKGIQWLRDNGPKAFNLIKRVTKELYPKLKAVGKAVIRLLPPLIKFGTTVANQILPHLTTFIDGLAIAFRWANKLAKRLPALTGKVMTLGQQFGLAKKDIRGLIGVIAPLGAILLGLTGPITTIIGLAAALGSAWSTNLFGIRTTTKRVLGKVRGLANKYGPQIKQAVSRAASDAEQSFATSFGQIQSTAQTALSQTRKNVKTLMAGIERQIIQKANNSSTEFGKNFSEMKQEARQTWNTISSVVNQVTSTIMGEIRPFLQEVSGLWRQHMTGSDGILASAREAFNTIWNNVIKPTIDTIQKAWQIFGDDIIKILDGTLGTLLTIAKIGMDAILTGINVILDLISGDWEEAWGHIKGFLKRTFKEIKQWVEEDAKQLLSGALGVVIDGIKAVFEGLYDWLIGNSFIQDTFGEIASYIKNDAASDLADAARNAAEAAAGALKDKFNSMLPDELSIPSVTIGGGSVGIPSKTIAGKKIGGGSLSIPSETVGGQSLNIPKLDTGGLVEETGLAVVHQGEQVVPRAEVDRSRDGGGGGVHFHSGAININADSRSDGVDAARGFTSELRSHNFDSGA